MEASGVSQLCTTFATSSPVHCSGRIASSPEVLHCIEVSAVWESNSLAVFAVASVNVPSSLIFPELTGTCDRAGYFFAEGVEVAVDWGTATVAAGFSAELLHPTIAAPARPPTVTTAPRSSRLRLTCTIERDVPMGVTGRPLSQS